MTTYTAPEFQDSAFNFPHCGAYAHMEWTTRDYLVYYQAICAHCEEYSLWRVTRTNFDGFQYSADEGEMLYPDFGSAPLPAEDMPEDVKKITKKPPKFSPNHPEAQQHYCV